MSDCEPKDRGEGGHEKSALEAESGYVEEVFRELFNLLEQYAPVWYTEEHHSRALAALRALKEGRQAAKAEAARSQSAS
jgi:hypothetical protein